MVVRLADAALEIHVDGALRLDSDAAELHADGALEALFVPAGEEILVDRQDDMGPSSLEVRLCWSRLARDASPRRRGKHEVGPALEARMVGVFDERIAVIGSGMAGLTVAWALRETGRRVTLFEGLPRRGMDAHATAVAGGGHVDAPLRVMSPDAWTCFFGLCARLGVETFAVDTGLSFSQRDGRTTLSTGRFELAGMQLPGALRLIARRHGRIRYGLAKLAFETKRGLPPDSVSLGELMAARDFDREFVDGFLLPVLSTICTCDAAVLRRWPARNILPLLHTILYGRRSQRVRGGVRSLVDKLVADVAAHANPVELRAGEPVLTVVPDDTGVRVATASHSDHFDRVVVATQANQTRFLDGTAYGREHALLARFPYVEGELVTHHDRRFMPTRRADWAPINYLRGHREDATHDSDTMWTVWLNPVEPSLAHSPATFQSWQPLFAPLPESVVARVTLQRAVVTSDSLRALLALFDLHGEADRRVFFCGSYAAPGVPLLESAVRSAISVAHRVAPLHRS